MELSPFNLLDLNIDLSQIFYHLYQISIAFLLALPIALNRENAAHGAGLRTFPLVAIASCAFMLAARNVFDNQEAEARVMYGIVTGIGFIGGGAIIKQSGRVGGTATAAGIWNTGAIGVSVAYGLYEIAIVLAVFNYSIFQFSGFFKRYYHNLEHQSRQMNEQRERDGHS